MIVERLARGELVPLLDHINAVAVPRANPDGAEAFRRTTANRIDLNRDHVLARTPEAPVLIALMPRPGTTSPVVRDQSRRFDRARDPARRLVVRARPTPERRDMVIVDHASGAPRPVTVEWRSSLALRLEVTRARPWGYVLPLSAAAAAHRLVVLEVAVDTLGAKARRAVERYRTVAVQRGADDIVVGQFELERAEAAILASSFVVTLDQRLEILGALVLEPDSAAGYVSHGLVALDAANRVPILRIADSPDSHVLALHPLQ